MATAWRTLMAPRDTSEPHRASTPLELFFDLCFVVAIAQAASGLHHGLVEDHVRDAVLSYPMVFFAIWWAWMNFTWFASAYDADDVPYRLAVLLQIAGALTLGAGIPRAMAGRDFGVVTVGYCLMRVGLIALWLRAARSHPDGRRCSHRYAAGVALCQVGWIALLGVPEDLRVAGFLLLVAAELFVPVYAERAGRTSWHPRHIAERYGLFTLIVLGESVLAASVAIQTALDAGGALTDLVTVIAGGLLIVFAMWWTYFDQPAEAVVERARRIFGSSSKASFGWGYGHLAVFASAAAVGAGLEVAIDKATDHAALSTAGAGAAVTVPAAIFLLSVWVLHAGEKPRGMLRSYVVPVAAVVIVGVSWLEQAPLVTGVVLAGLVGIAIATHARQPAPTLGG